MPLAEDEGTFLLGTRTAGLSSHSPNPLASGALCSQQSLTCVSDCLLSSQGFCGVVFCVSTQLHIPDFEGHSVPSSEALEGVHIPWPAPRSACAALPMHSVTFFGYFQACWLHQCPGQPVPRTEHLLSEDIFPIIQSKPALEQMKGTLSLPGSELQQTLLPTREGSSMTCRWWDAPKSGTNGKYRTDMPR